MNLLKGMQYVEQQGALGRQENRQRRFNALAGQLPTTDPDDRNALFGKLAALNPKEADALRNSMQARQSTRLNGLLDQRQAALARGKAQHAQQMDYRERVHGAARYMAGALQTGDPQRIEGAYQAVRPMLAELSGKEPPMQWDPAMADKVYEIVASTGGGEIEEPDAVTGRNVILPSGEAAITYDDQTIMQDGQSVPIPEGAYFATPQGSAEAVGISPATRNDLEGSFQASQTGLKRLEGVMNSFDPRYLTYAGKIKTWMANLESKLGGTLSPEQKKLVKGYGNFQSRALDNINRYIHHITGAQMSKWEAKRIMKAMPDPLHNSPVEFVAKLHSVMDQLRAIQERTQYALGNGMDPKELPLTDFMGDGESDADSNQSDQGDTVLTYNPETGELE